MNVRTGGCACGAIRYALEAEPQITLHCHCRFCRRAHGAGFVTLCVVRSRSLRFVRGAELVRERHTPGVGLRAFCPTCATRLYNRGESTPGVTSLVAGSLDEADGVVPRMHINVESKAGWLEIHDDLPRFAALPEGFGGGA
jgi:hypothetical protein